MRPIFAIIIFILLIKGDDKIRSEISRRVFNEERFAKRYPHSFRTGWILTVLALCHYEQRTRRTVFIQPCRRNRYGEAQVYVFKSS